MTAFTGVNEETRETAKDRSITVAPETWGGACLVRVTAETAPLPQHRQTVYLSAHIAVAAGYAMIRAALPGANGYDALVRPALEIYLLANGWAPCEGGGDDWTPPEDRGNPWDFERAVAEQRRREKETE